MSDKQRADHVQAKYWNGFITRTEIQKVIDEQSGVIAAQAMAIQKLDAVITYVTEKFGISVEEINNWMKAKVEAAQAAQKDAQAQQGQQAQATQPVASVPDATGDSTPSPIILTD